MLFAKVEKHFLIFFTRLGRFPGTNFPNVKKEKIAKIVVRKVCFFHIDEHVLSHRVGFNCKLNVQFYKRHACDVTAALVCDGV